LNLRPTKSEISQILNIFEIEFLSMPKLKVALLYGGRSVEHGVSINSARNIEAYIDKNQFEVYCIGISKSGTWHLTPTVDKNMEQHAALQLTLNPSAPSFTQSEGKEFCVDVAFPVLHGTDGEDGSIQGLLKAMDLPVVGTGVLGSAVSMSKLVTKQLLVQAGIPVSPFIHFNYSDREKISFEAVREKLGLPFMVKSASLGSSVGVSKVKQQSEFQAAVDDAFRYDDCVIFEMFIKGRELECAILGNDPPQASLPGEILVSKNYDFYTFDAKYVDSEAVKIDVPARIDAKISDEIRNICIKTYQVMHCEDFARIDLFLSHEGKIFINEINTIPGFTNSSMYPMMWKEQGVSFTQLITKLIELSLDRFRQSKRIDRDYRSALRF
jgi:D-alanine-D-alanine ligase